MRPRLSTRRYDHCFGLVVVEFQCVHCHPSFDAIKTLLHGEEEIWDLMSGHRFLELSHRRMSGEGQSTFQ